ncbi:MAG: 1A family penicillin-binding protein, penicillin-binding protein 1A [Candidatus Peregrinibacteria bacterium GW2011_GWC2_39_14]|nr:MAG: Glycosyl transferase family protein [Candidatus Peregrinibacteria bacterium GW2011_GWA2_38_36]KKR05912.1 MAG: 1A family penicillin-binding protein, penicillin-binding protein 1A [Candidatus Peregrinibacteria bacterium GW2011_GWC2_39_14]
MKKLHTEKIHLKIIHALIFAIKAFVSLFIAGIILFFLLIAIFSIGLPNVKDVQSLSPTLSTEIFDRNGVSLYSIFGEENRKYTDYEKISPYVVNATISIEDESFWNHKGFDMGGIAQAILHEFTGLGAQRGGSTLTQQYVKNFFLSRERSYTRKLKELILAVRLEQYYPKQKILELYLNQIPYGNNAYGIGKAAEIYFNKTPDQLTLGESALLASLPQLPSYYNPYGEHKLSTLTKIFTPEEIENRNIKTEADLKDNEFNRGLIGKTYDLDATHKLYVQGRADIILRRMVELGYITPFEKNAAWQETQKIAFNPMKNIIKAPHFVFYVKELLEQKYGKEIMEQSGLKVYTTLDWTIQEAAEKAIDARAKDNEKLKVSNSALIATDPKKGQILAMVGSRDYFNDDIDGKVNVATHKRLPGSSFKPIVYAQAFLNRYSPSTVLYDVPTKIGPDKPSNFDGKWMGPVSIRQALGKSRNIPAIKAYFLAGEQKQIIDLATQLGITTLDQNHDYGYPLAIGAGEVTMMEMATAYGTFATGGYRQDLYPILKIENAKGDIIEEWKDKEPKEALDTQVAYLINSILSDRSVNVGTNLNIDGHVNAAKTGTSTNKTKSKGTAYPVDLWTIGYTPSYVVAVWSGNSDGSATSYSADGYTVSAPIWKEVMSFILKDKTDEQFLPPSGIKHVAISTLSGLLPSNQTPSNKIKNEIFASFAVPTEIDNSIYELEVDTKTNKIATEFCPKEIVEKRLFQSHKDPISNPAWEQGIQDWIAIMQKNPADPSLNLPPPTDPNAPVPEAPTDPAAPQAPTVLSTPPTETCDVHTITSENRKPTVSILYPTAYSEVSGNIDIEISYTAPLGVDVIEYYFDGMLRRADTMGANRISLKVPKYSNPGEKYLISVKVHDKLGYTAESAVEIRLKGEAPNVIFPQPEPIPLFNP